MKPSEININQRVRNILFVILQFVLFHISESTSSLNQGKAGNEKREKELQAGHSFICTLYE